VLFRSGFESVGHDGVYLPLPVAPGYEPFKATLHALTDHDELGFAGASVTLPHKEHAARFAREEGWPLDADARDLAAANTIAGERVLNTDTNAIADAVAEHCPGATRALVLGAGGAARAAAWTLREAGWSVAIWNRTTERAQTLARELGVRATGDIYSAIVDARLIVNATPVGMTGGPAPGETPIPDDLLLSSPDDAVVFDTVYTPLETPLLRRAREIGRKTIGGAEMFVRQAALQFQEWTGAPAPEDLFERITRESLGDAD